MAETLLAARRHISIARFLFLAVALIGTRGSAAVNEGVLLWAKQCGGNDRDGAQSVAVLPDGSYLVLGFFENHFAPGPAPHTFGLRDLFVAKYDADGVLQWVKSAGSGHCDVGSTISALPDGTFAITAYYGYGGASIAFGYGEPGQVTLGHWNHYDICLAKFNADGALQWARRAGGNGWDYGDDVALAPDGSCYIAGTFEMSATFGIEDPPTQAVLVAGDGSSDSNDAFCARYRPEGSLAWVKQGCYRKVAALPDGSCITALDPDASGAGGLPDVLVRYGADGEELWRDESLLDRGFVWDISSQPGTSEFLVGVENSYDPDTVRKYRVETDGSVTLVWETEKETGAMSVGVVKASPDGTAFAYDRLRGRLYRFLPDGTLDWQAPLINRAADVAVSPVDGSCLVVGGLYEATVFGPGQPNQTALEHWGSGDVLLAKYHLSTFYSLEVRCVGEGYATLDPPGGCYPEGARVTVKTSPWWPQRSAFLRWEDDFAAYDTPTVTIDMPSADVHATAVFEQFADAPPLPALPATGLGALIGLLALTAVRRRR